MYDTPLCPPPQPTQKLPTFCSISAVVARYPTNQSNSWGSCRDMVSLGFRDGGVWITVGDCPFLYPHPSLFLCLSISLSLSLYSSLPPDQFKQGFSKITIWTHHWHMDSYWGTNRRQCGWESRRKTKGDKQKYWCFESHYLFFDCQEFYMSLQCMDTVGMHMLWYDVRASQSVSAPQTIGSTCHTHFHLLFTLLTDFFCVA